MIEKFKASMHTQRLVHPYFWMISVHQSSKYKTTLRFRKIQAFFPILLFSKKNFKISLLFAVLCKIGGPNL